MCILELLAGSELVLAVTCYAESIKLYKAVLDYLAKPYQKLLAILLLQAPPLGMSQLLKKEFAGDEMLTLHTQRRISLALNDDRELGWLHQLALLHAEEKSVMLRTRWQFIRYQKAAEPVPKQLTYQPVTTQNTATPVKISKE